MELCRLPSIPAASWSSRRAMRQESHESCPQVRHLDTPDHQELQKLLALKDELGELSHMDEKKFKQSQNATERELLQARVSDVVTVTRPRALEWSDLVAFASVCLVVELFPSLSQPAHRPLTLFAPRVWAQAILAFRTSGFALRTVSVSCRSKVLLHVDVQHLSLLLFDSLVVQGCVRVPAQGIVRVEHGAGRLSPEGQCQACEAERDMGQHWRRSIFCCF